jgi:drug/metabolite transporter (DMT)-like permease
MTLFVTSIVLVAAVLHATWNALVKGAGDKTVMLGLIALGHVVPGIAVALWLPAPDPASWPYIVASTVIHWVYYLGLNAAYRVGDLSLVYPVARGLAPVMIALGALFFADEHLAWWAWAGIVTVSAGIMMLTRWRAGARPLGLAAAIGTAITVAAYSVVDGIGVRLSGQPVAYIAWLFVAEICVVGFVLLARADRVRATAPRVLWLGFAGGVLSGLAYGLVLYAKTLAPLGMVSALRETSVVIAALIGVWWFRERPVGRRLIAASVVVAGIVLLVST